MVAPAVRRGYGRGTPNSSSKSFGKVGIETTHRTTDVGGWLQRDANWDFELCFNYLSQFMEPALGVARTYVSSNIRKGISPAMSPVTRTRRSMTCLRVPQWQTDPAAAQKLYSDAQRLISDDLPENLPDRGWNSGFINKRRSRT